MRLIIEEIWTVTMAVVYGAGIIVMLYVLSVYGFELSSRTAVPWLMIGIFSYGVFYFVRREMRLIERKKGSDVQCL